MYPVPPHGSDSVAVLDLKHFKFLLWGGGETLYGTVYGFDLPGSLQNPTAIGWLRP